MLNSWFTIVAQAINFLILVWLLKRFLYKPILGAIDAREKGIAAQLAKAEADVAAAKKAGDDFRQKNEAFDRERATLLTKAVEAAKIERQRLLDEAQKDADALRTKRENALKTEQQNLTQEVAGWTRKEVMAITRKTLQDLAGASLDERVADVFIERLRGLTGPAKDQLAATIKALPKTPLIRSAVALPPARRLVIENTIKEVFDADAQVQFSVDPALISGIELTVSGQKAAWSISDHLATLEKSFSDLLPSKTNVASAAKPQETAK